MKEDFITCGACSTTFALSDMNKFIDHKKSSCAKEPKSEEDASFECIKCEQHFESASDLLRHYAKDHEVHLYKGSSSLASKLSGCLKSYQTKVSQNPYFPYLSTAQESLEKDHYESSFEMSDFAKPTAAAAISIAFNNDHSKSSKTDNQHQTDFCQLIVACNNTHEDLNSILDDEGSAFDSQQKISQNWQYNLDPPRFNIESSAQSIVLTPNLPLNGFHVNGQSAFSESGEGSISSNAQGPISLQVPAQGFTITAPPKNAMFKCMECGNTFRQKVHLRKHIINHHSKNKPFQCPYCAYTTVERSHLTVHIRTHTGEKPYMCRVCDYTSTQNCTLKSHYLRRHPTSKVHCRICDKAFVTEQERDNHQKACLEQKHLFNCSDQGLPLSATFDNDSASRTGDSKFKING